MIQHQSAFHVDLTYDQAQDLNSSINESNLSNDEKALMNGFIDFNAWLQQQILEKKGGLPAS